ncbi:unnamed protein product, partial [Anisakis simplex]|uniref:Uncharacterized protein n=1 Tax=Anisakis simplex TaxID=6269 RepID=A0A0M3JAR0_ANISI
MDYSLTANRKRPTTVLIGSSHSRAAVSSVLCTPSSHQSLVRSSPVYSTTSMLSSSYSSIPSISTSTTTSSSHRPQAIVSPMTSVNSSNVNSSAIVQSSASKETLLEGNEFMKTDDDHDE